MHNGVIMTAGVLQEADCLGQLASALPDDRWIDLVRRYLMSWGVADEQSARIGAQRLVSAVLSEWAPSDDPSASTDQSREELRLTLIQRTRSWVQHFAFGVVGPSPEAFFRTPALLSKFPRAFLETPIPAAGDVPDGSPSLLPSSLPRPMMQQAIVDSVEQMATSIREVIDRIRGVRVAEAPRLIEPAP